MKTPATFCIYAKMVKVERGKWPVTKRKDNIKTESRFNENCIYVHVGFVHVLLIFGKQKFCKLVVVL